MAYIEGGDVNTVDRSSQLKMKLTGTIIHPGKLNTHIKFGQPNGIVL